MFANNIILFVCPVMFVSLGIRMDHVTLVIGMPRAAEKIYTRPGAAESLIPISSKPQHLPGRFDGHIFKSAALKSRRERIRIK